MEEFCADADLAGTTFLDHARAVLEEVLSVGRAGTLVLWDEAAARPCLSLWRAEQILDWEFQRLNGRLVLTRLALAADSALPASHSSLGISHSSFPEPPFKSEISNSQSAPSCLRLWLHNGQCVIEEHRSGHLVRRAYLRKNGEPLRTVPFAFHAPRSAPAADP